MIGAHLIDRRRTAVAAALATVVGLGALTTACGVPTGENTYSEIPSEEIPFGLDQTSTSTTTTTTTTTTIADPPPTTTAPPVRTETAEIYFLSRGRLQPIQPELPSPITADQIADVLEEGPPPDVGLETLIEDGLIVATSESGGVLTVDLDSETFERIPSTQQTEAIGQIVMTMLANVRLVGQVTFTSDGEPISVRLGNGFVSEVGQPVSFDDYDVLLRSSATSPSSTATSTTFPPEDTAVTTAPPG
jgi:hypothetical protein